MSLALAILCGLLILINIWMVYAHLKGASLTPTFDDIPPVVMRLVVNLFIVITKEN
jgi:hypothetical protein